MIPGMIDTRPQKTGTIYYISSVSPRKKETKEIKREKGGFRVKR